MRHYPNMQMKKFNKRRISFMVLAPLALVIFLVFCAGGYVYIALKSDISSLQQELLKGEIRTVKATFDQKHSTSEMTAKLFNQEFDTFYAAVASADTVSIKDELQWSASSIQACGYLFTNVDGGYVCGSYPEDELDAQQLVLLAEIVDQRGMVTASGDFINNQICDFTAVLVKNGDGEKLGMAVIVNFVSSSDATLKAMNDQLGVDCFIFHGDKCVLSANEEREASSIVLDPEISLACYSRLTPWMGVSDMLGRDMHIFAIPLVSADAKALGCIVIKSDTDSTDRIISSLRILVPAFLAVFLAVFFVLSFRINMRVIRPLGDIVNGVNRISRGDISQPVVCNNACYEIETLANSLNDAQDKFRMALTPIYDTTEALMNSADQLSNASESLSNAANRQAASLEEISSSMEQMGANIQQNTDNSVHTNKLTEEMSAMASKLGGASSNSFEAIQNIAKNINDINDLVSQTNILALNASVEAARAGEHGQGFGVVAKEVGRLAEQTHETADSINETATSSINEAEEAFNQTQQLMPRIEKIASLIKEITTASVEQSSGVAQVNTAILDLNRVTQQNAAGAEEIAASTMQMRDMVNDLQKSVAMFKL